MVWFGMIRYDIAWCDIIWCDIIRYYMIWVDMVRYMIWYNMLRHRTIKCWYDKALTWYYLIACFVLYLSDALVEDVLAHMGVHSAEDVVQQHDVGVRVHRPRQANPLLLPPRQVDPLLTYLRLVPRIQDLEILKVSITRRFDISVSFCISINRYFDKSIVRYCYTSIGMWVDNTLLICEVFR